MNKFNENLCFLKLSYAIYRGRANSPACCHMPPTIVLHLLCNPFLWSDRSVPVLAAQYHTQ